MGSQRALGCVEMANVVLGRVLRPTDVQQLEHSLLESAYIDAPRQQIVLMEHVAEKVPIIDFPDQETLEISAGARTIRGHCAVVPHPMPRYPPRCHDVTPGSVRRPRHGEAAQHCLLRLLGRAFEHLTRSTREKFAE